MNYYKLKKLTKLKNIAVTNAKTARSSYKYTKVGI